MRRVFSDEIVEKIKKYAAANNLKINEKVLKVVILKEGFCPCRRDGTKCPCEYALEEIKTTGRCFCGLFSKKNLSEINYT